MADKPINQLVAATQVTPSDLFVLEQSGTAKKLTGQVLENWLVSFADGHGGIQKIEKLSTSGLVDTYRITLADTTSYDFTVTNGKGIKSIVKTGTVGLVDTYTITYTDSTTSTFEVKNGAKGDKGDNTYTFIKYAAVDPQTPPHSFGDLPDKWLGIYAGSMSTAPTLWSDYKWYEIKGAKGDTGAPATLTSAVTEYQVSTSGTVIPSGVWSTVVPPIVKGKYLWTRITTQFNTGKAVVSYTVAYSGIDGSGTVKSVNAIEPDSDGNIKLTTSDVVEKDGITTNMLQSGAVYGSKLRNATEKELGGIKAPLKTAEQTYQVHVDSNGNAWVGGIKIVKLWENASPTSEFPAQVVQMGTNAYKFFMIVFKARNTGSNYTVAFTVKNTEDTVSITYGSAGGIESLYRTVEVKDGSVYFRAAYIARAGSDTSNSGVMIPYTVYGIEGVE